MSQYLINGPKKGKGIVSVTTKGDPLNQFTVTFSSNGDGEPYTGDEAKAADDSVLNILVADKVGKAWKISKATGSFGQYKGKKLKDPDMMNLLKSTNYKG